MLPAPNCLSDDPDARSPWHPGGGTEKTESRAGRMLVVEDDLHTANAMRWAFEANGYRVVLAQTAEEALARLGEEVYAIVLLDWILPGRDGLELLRLIRASGSDIPVCLLSGRAATEDRVLALESGADDYVVKPVVFAELLARVHALQRRAAAEAVSWRIGDLQIDAARRRVLRGGRELILTLREFDLLVYLARHHDRIVTREMLVHEVWREVQRTPSLDNAIDVHIAHLRQKVERRSAAKLIHTIRGAGFMLRAE